MTVAELNGLSVAGFVEQVGWVVEHSPWVAERAALQRPFANRDELLRALVAQLEAATRDKQLAVLRAHPDLGARARMSDASVGEQAGVGLDRLTPEEFGRLQRLNSAYKERFGFPFLYAVKGSTKYAILEALEERLRQAPEVEFAEALRQVARIVGFRISESVGG